jgi:hypothetical protein
MADVDHQTEEHGPGAAIVVDDDDEEEEEDDASVRYDHDTVMAIMASRAADLRRERQEADSPSAFAMLGLPNEDASFADKVRSSSCLKIATLCGCCGLVCLWDKLRLSCCVKRMPRLLAVNNDAFDTCDMEMIDNDPPEIIDIDYSPPSSRGSSR